LFYFQLGGGGGGGGGIIGGIVFTFIIGGGCGNRAKEASGGGGGGGGIVIVIVIARDEYTSSPLNTFRSLTPISSPTFSQVTSNPFSNIIIACSFALSYDFCIPGGGGGTSFSSQFLTMNSTILRLFLLL